MVLLALTLGQYAPALAQSEGDTPADAATGEEVEEVEEKEPAAPGEPSLVDPGSAIEIGPERLFIPLVSGSGTADARAAAVATITVIDEFCNGVVGQVPPGWSSVDYNSLAPEHDWVRAIVLGFCVARPNAYVNSMNVHMTRNISTIGGTVAGANLIFRFRMNTEQSFDYLRYEYSCNSRKTFRGGTTIADSGAFGGASFISRTISLVGCDESSSVAIRFWFVTDQSVIGAERPSIDRVTLED
jgi:hypothetical protein